jgi:hypothetical protein
VSRLCGIVVFFVVGKSDFACLGIPSLEVRIPDRSTTAPNVAMIAWKSRDVLALTGATVAMVRTIGKEITSFFLSKSLHQKTRVESIVEALKLGLRSKIYLL